MGKNFVFGGVLVFLLLFSTQNQVPQIIIIIGVVVSSCSQASIRLQSQLVFVDNFQYSTIAIVEIDLLRRFVCQTVTVAILWSYRSMENQF